MVYTKTHDNLCQRRGHMDPVRGEIKERCFKCGYVCCRDCGECQVPSCPEFGG